MSKLKYLLLVLSLFLLTLNEAKSQTVLPLTESTMDSILTANKGKVVLFNFWAFWCQPCREEFPDLLKLRSEYKDRGLEVIFVTLDFGKEIDAKSKPFLTDNKIDFITYYNDFPKQDSLINRISSKWDGGIPATIIYDKDGTPKEFFEGKRKYSDFESAVLKLIE